MNKNDQCVTRKLTARLDQAVHRQLLTLAGFLSEQLIGLGLACPTFLGALCWLLVLLRSAALVLYEQLSCPRDTGRAQRCLGRHGASQLKRLQG